MRAAVSVHDALRPAGRARGVDDVGRVVGADLHRRWAACPTVDTSAPRTARSSSRSDSPGVTTTRGRRSERLDGSETRRAVRASANTRSTPASSIVARPRAPAPGDRSAPRPLPPAAPRGSRSNDAASLRQGDGDPVAGVDHAGVAAARRRGRRASTYSPRSARVESDQRLTHRDPPSTAAQVPDSASVLGGPARPIPRCYERSRPAHMGRVVRCSADESPATLVDSRGSGARVGRGHCGGIRPTADGRRHVRSRPPAQDERRPSGRADAFPTVAPSSTDSRWAAAADFGVLGLKTPAALRRQRPVDDRGAADVRGSRLGRRRRRLRLRAGVAGLRHADRARSSRAPTQQKPGGCRRSCRGRPSARSPCRSPRPDPTSPRSPPRSPRSTTGSVIDGEKAWVTLGPRRRRRHRVRHDRSGQGPVGHHRVPRPHRHRQASRSDRSRPRAGSTAVRSGAIRFEDCFVPADACIGPAGARRGGLQLWPSRPSAPSSTPPSSGVDGTPHRSSRPAGPHPRPVRQADRRVPGGLPPHRRHEAPARSGPAARLQGRRPCTTGASPWRWRPPSPSCRPRRAPSPLPSTWCRIHGAEGYTEAAGLELDLRDAVGGLAYSGTSDIQRNIVAGPPRRRPATAPRPTGISTPMRRLRPHQVHRRLAAFAGRRARLGAQPASAHTGLSTYLYLDITDSTSVVASRCPSLTSAPCSASRSRGDRRRDPRRARAGAPDRISRPTSTSTSRSAPMGGVRQGVRHPELFYSRCLEESDNYVVVDFASTCPTPRCRVKLDVTFDPFFDEVDGSRRPLADRQRLGGRGHRERA